MDESLPRNFLPFLRWCFLALLGICALLPHRLSAQVGPLRTVVIDPGHGGKDGGCDGHYLDEKHMTLKLALRLGAAITAAHPDVKVIYTRDADVDIALHERTKIANAARADLFISIHCNADGQAVGKGGKAYGTETYVLGMHRTKDNLAVAKRENAAIKYEKDYQTRYGGLDPDSDGGHILATFYQNQYLTQSVDFASAIEQAYVERGRKSRGVKQAGFFVLRGTTMPSVLTEVGFLTHAQEAAYIDSDTGQAAIAQCLLDAFTVYKAGLDANAASARVVAIRGVSAPPARGTEYRIQLAATRQSPDRTQAPWRDIDLLEVESSGGLYRLLVGRYQGYDYCAKALRYWQTHGFPDAFVVAYRDGRRISVAAALGQ